MSTRKRQRVDWSDLNDWDDSTAFDDWGTVEIASDDDHETVPQPTSSVINNEKTRSTASPSAKATSRKRNKRPARQKRAKTANNSIDEDDLIKDRNDDAAVDQSGYDDHVELNPRQAIIDDDNDKTTVDNGDDKTTVDTEDHIVRNDDLQGDATQVKQDLGSWLDQSSMMQNYDDLASPIIDEEDDPAIKDDETGVDYNSLFIHLPSNNEQISDEATELPLENDGNDTGLPIGYDDGVNAVDEVTLDENNGQATRPSSPDGLEMNTTISPASTGVDDQSVNDHNSDGTAIEKSLAGLTRQASHDSIDDGKSSSEHGSQLSYNTFSDADTKASMLEFLGDDSDYEEMAKARQILRQKRGRNSMMRFRPHRQALDSLAAASTARTRPVPTASPFGMEDTTGDNAGTTSDNAGSDIDTEPSYDSAMGSMLPPMAKPSTRDHDDNNESDLPVEDYNESTIADAIDHADNDYAGSNDTDIDKMIAGADIDDDDRIDLDSPSSTGDSEYEDDSLQFDDNEESADEPIAGESTGLAKPGSLSKRRSGGDEAPQAEVELDVDDSAPVDSTGDEKSNADSNGKPKSSLGGLFKKFLAQAKSELHGGDDGEDAPQESEPAVEPSREKIGSSSDDEDREPRKKPSLKETIGLLKSPVRLFGLIRHTIATARKLSMIIGLVIALIIAWAGTNIPSVLDKGSASGQSVDEGTITVTKTAWRDSTAFVTVKNKSDMIAHVGGKAVVRSWAPSSSPLTWIGARETASCIIPSTDVDPGATKEIKTTGCSKPSGVWHRVKAELEYE